MIKNLDLGGTACSESKEWVSISLDGTTSDDTVVYNMIGDYKHMPYANATFAEAFGCCLLEEEDEQYLEIYAEIFRVLKPGGILKCKGCGIVDESHLEHALAAGFELVEMATWYQEDMRATNDDEPDLCDVYDNPYVFRKPGVRFGPPQEDIHYNMSPEIESQTVVGLWEPELHCVDIKFKAKFVTNDWTDDSKDMEYVDPRYAEARTKFEAFALDALSIHPGAEYSAEFIWTDERTLRIFYK